MGKKHFLCTHTWTNEQARDQFLNVIGQMTDREYLAAVSTEQAEFGQLVESFGTSHSWNVERMLHDLIDLEAYGAP